MTCVAVKDPTVVRYKDRWHVFASSVARGGIYGMVYTSFADWSDAPKAPLYYMDNTRGFKTYVAAPQVFYFTPQKKWYLVYQSGPPMFSTADDSGDPDQVDRAVVRSSRRRRRSSTRTAAGWTSG